MPSENHPLRYREIVARLKRLRNVEEKRGKGVTRKLIGVVEGRKECYSLDVHNEHHEFSRHYTRAIRERFKISPSEFYA